MPAEVNMFFQDGSQQIFTWSRFVYETCSELTIKTPERRHWQCSGVIIVYSEHIS